MLTEDKSIKIRKLKTHLFTEISLLPKLTPAFYLLYRQLVLISRPLLASAPTLRPLRIGWQDSKLASSFLKSSLPERMLRCGLDLMLDF